MLLVNLGELHTLFVFFHAHFLLALLVLENRWKSLLVLHAVPSLLVWWGRVGIPNHKHLWSPPFQMAGEGYDNADFGEFPQPFSSPSDKLTLVSLLPAINYCRLWLCLYRILTSFLTPVKMSQAKPAIQGFPPPPPHLLASCNSGFSTWWREMCELQAPFSQIYSDGGGRAGWSVNQCHLITDHRIGLKFNMKMDNGVLLLCYFDKICLILTGNFWWALVSLYSEARL